MTCLLESAGSCRFGRLAYWRSRVANDALAELTHQCLASFETDGTRNHIEGLVGKFELKQDVMEFLQTALYLPSTSLR